MPELKRVSIPPLVFDNPRNRKSDKLFSFVFSKDIRDWMPKLEQKRKQAKKYRDIKFVP